MDTQTRAKVNLMASKLKITIDIMVACENNVELDVYRSFAHSDIDYLCNILHEENRGEKDAEEN